MILSKAFFLNDLVVCSGVAPCLYEDACAHIYTNTHTHLYMCVYTQHMHIYCLRSRYKPTLGEPSCWHASQLTPKANWCAIIQPSPSCHFMREELKHRDASDYASQDESRRWVIGPGVTLCFPPPAFQCLPALPLPMRQAAPAVYTSPSLKLRDYLHSQVCVN